jgi:hypothetical protein
MGLSWRRVHASAKDHQRVIRAFQLLGFRLVRQREHISMIRANPDGTNTPLTLPNHPYLKASTLRARCTQAGVSREDFVTAYASA